MNFEIFKYDFRFCITFLKLRPLNLRGINIIYLSYTKVIYNTIYEQYISNQTTTSLYLKFMLFYQKNNQN